MNIAFFPTSTETFFTKIDRKLYTPYLFINSSLHTDRTLGSFAEKTFRLVPYQLITKKPINDLTYEEIIIDKNFTSACKSHHINAIVAPYRISEKMNRWSISENIGFISVPYSDQKKLEHKIWFDGFLKLNEISKPLTISYSLDKLKKIHKIVLQDPESDGSEGTYIITDEKKIDMLLRSRKVNKKNRYLIREFIPGDTYGISIYVNNDLISLSSLRKQIYISQQKKDKSFNGIQWVTPNAFNQHERDEINNTFVKLGLSLLRSTYRGLLSFDFILHNERCYVLECNPRLTSATVQLLSHNELINNIDFVYEDIMSYSEHSKNEAEKIKIFRVPNTHYTGSTMFLKGVHGKKIDRIFDNGVYAISNGSITFISYDFKEFSRHDNQFIVYSEACKDEKYKDDDIVTDIYANFSMYTKMGQMNDGAKKIVKYFNYYD